MLRSIKLMAFSTKDLQDFATRSQRSWFSHCWTINKLQIAAAVCLFCAYGRTHLFHCKASALAAAFPFWEINFVLFALTLIASLFTVAMERHIAARYCEVKNGILISFRLSNSAEQAWRSWRIWKKIKYSAAIVIGLTIAEMLASSVSLVLTKLAI